jgi:Domain of unknown function (DUF4279)
MMEPSFYSSVTIQFWGDNLVPETISKSLGVMPSMSTTKGGPLLYPEGDRPGSSKTGAWTLRSAWNDQESPEQKVASLFDRMTLDIGTWKEIVTAFSGRLLCNIERTAGRQGFRLSPSTLAMIEKRGLPIVFVLEQDAG